MHNFIKGILLLLAMTGIAYGGTCTSISRTNNAANSVLTSAKYNADLNSSYSNQNAYDLGCGTDGTLESGALNTTDFFVPLNYFKDGCKVTRSDGATLSVDKCAMAVNGAWIRTTSANTVTWGCTDCVSESNDARFYLYAKNGSTGTTLNLLISSTAPNNDGYDASSNKILASFYNNTSGDITLRIANWNGYGFDDQETFTAIIANNGTASITSQNGSAIASVNRSAAGAVTITYSEDFFTATPSCLPVGNGGSEIVCKVTALSAVSCAVLCENMTNSNDNDINFSVAIGRQGADVW
jgi:hypothetical protein